MANAYKVLAQGQLSNSVGTLYTVPAATSTIVHHIILVNTDVADRTARLYIGGTADANEILPPSTILTGGWAEDDGVHTLETGQTIRGYASVASKVTYTIEGVEIT